MKQLTVFITLFLSGLIVNSQTLKELTEMKQKKKERMIKLRNFKKPNKKGEGLSPALHKNPPKRIGIVSFYLIDEGYQYSYNTGTKESFGKTYRTKKIHGRQLGNKSGSALANSLLAMILNPMDSIFEEQGFEFMVPREFLDTEKKVNIYNNFKPEVTKVSMAMYNTIMGFAASATNDMGGTVANAKGFKLMPFHVFKTDYRFLESMGAFADTLGLDAVIVMMATTPSKKKAVEMENVQLAIYGPNPIPEGDRWHPGLSYNSGMMYSDAKLKLKKDPEIIEVDKRSGAFEKIKLEGFDELITLFTKEVVTDLKNRCNGEY